MVVSVDTEAVQSHSKGKVTLTGAQETLLITLLARAKDVESPHPILNDRYAAAVVAQIRDSGYDFCRADAGRMDRSNFLSRQVTVRARVLDRATEDFLSRNPGRATVLHLACGLDSRSLRVKWQGEGRLWIDVDKKDVIELRRQVMNNPEPGRGEYRLLDPSITEQGWLKNCNIPADRPVLVIMEGLTMYLSADEVHGLLRQIVEHFQHNGVQGEIRFDALGSITVWFMNNIFSGPLAKMGTHFRWSLNNPKTLEKEVPGLKYKDRVDFWRFDQFANIGLLGRMIQRIFVHILNLFSLITRLGAIYGYVF